MKVLIIDDEEDFRTIASSCLGLLGGAEVVEASSGEEGLRKAEADQPDVILLDLVMPGMDGHGAPYEDGEHAVVDRAAWHCT